jgi:hypothetical protein
VEPGDIVTLRTTGEPLTVVAVLDASGTLLVRTDGEEPFQATRDEVETVRERHGSCCGAC